VVILRIASKMNLQKHQRFAIEFPVHTALIVRSIHHGSPLGAAGAREGFVMFSADPTPASRSEFFQVLSKFQEPLTLQMGSVTDSESRPLTIVPGEVGVWDNLLVGMLRVVGEWLPVSTSPQATRNALMVVLGGVLLMVLFSNACRFVSQYMIIIASSRAIMDMRRAMYCTVLHLPITWFGRHLSETMSRVVTDCRDVERGYRALFGKLTTEPIKMVGLLIAALITDWRITLFAMVAGPLGILIVSWLGRKIRKANRKLLAGYAQMMGVLNGALSGIRVVRAYNAETVERRRMWQAERRLLKQLLRIGRFESMTGPLLELMGVGVAMIGIVILAERVFTGALPPEVHFRRDSQDHHGLPSAGQGRRRRATRF